MKTDKIIYIYESWSCNTPMKLGELFVECVRGDEHYSFAYDSEWLKKNSQSYLLDPDLSMYKGRQYPIEKSIFGIFADSSPDRWGRTLMKRRESQLARKEGRKARKLTESDYLLGVYDETRMGALRFALEDNGPFLSEDSMQATPPITTLRTLEEASREYEKAENIRKDEWLNQLIKPGSSLGGARPKANVIDVDGSLWIAKFPSKDDEFNVGAWEKVVHDLAKLCLLDVPQSRLETFSKYGSTFLVKRFDRNNQQRIHFSSAMTMLGKVDGETSKMTSYLDIVSFIKENGALPKQDLIELWKRIVFNMAVSNIDDHLRNHGFLLSDNGWRLSPLFDVNPLPYGEELSLQVSESDNRISIELAIDTSDYYGISKKNAQSMASDILMVVKNNWEKIATSYGLNRTDIEDMRDAFMISDLYNEK